MKQQAPVCPRSLFELLTKLNDNQTIAELLEEVDWAGVTPKQIYLSILGRLPESAEVAAQPEGYNAADHARAAIESQEFQTNIIERLLLAYPEKQRLIFIHVPKCAGTDLIIALADKYPCVHETLASADWTRAEAFFKTLAKLVRKISASDTIFVAGHIPLPWFVDRNLCRFHDRLVTVMRHPFEIALSNVNYLMKRLDEVPQCDEPDTRDWAKALGIHEFKQDWPQETKRELALRAFRSPEIVFGNYMCHYLGLGDAKSACDFLFRCEVEITNVSLFDQWRKERFGIHLTTRANMSTAILTPDMLTDDDLAYFRSKWAEDIVLYAVLEEAFQRIGRNWVCGSELPISATCVTA